MTNPQLSLHTPYSCARGGLPPLALVIPSLYHGNLGVQMVLGQVVGCRWGGQGGWGSEQFILVEGVPGLSRGVGTR